MPGLGKAVEPFPGPIVAASSTTRETYRQVTLADMKISAADGAGQDLDQQFAGSRGRHRFLHVPKRADLGSVLDITG